MLRKDKNTGPGPVDDPLLEVVEVPPALRSGVGHGRDARAEGEAVRVDAAVSGVRPALAGPGVDVHVDVDQPRRDVKTGDVDDLGKPFDGSIDAATAAILPPRMATLRTVPISFLGSMTCPPRSRRS